MESSAFENVTAIITNPQIGYATATNTANAVVLRDASGNFNAGTITATLSGNASSATQIATSQKSDNVNYQIPFVTTVTAGNQSLYTDSAANITYNPSTNTLTATTFVGALTGTASGNLTSSSTLDASKLSGTIPSAVLGNSTVYIGSTEVALNRATGTLALTGVTNTN